MYVYIYIYIYIYIVLLSNFFSYSSLTLSLHNFIVLQSVTCVKLRFIEKKIKRGYLKKYIIDETKLFQIKNFITFSANLNI